MPANHLHRVVDTFAGTFLPELRSSYLPMDMDMDMGMGLGMGLGIGMDMVWVWVWARYSVPYPPLDSTCLPSTHRV